MPRAGPPMLQRISGSERVVIYGHDVDSRDLLYRDIPVLGLGGRLDVTDKICSAPIVAVCAYAPLAAVGAVPG